MRLALVIAFTLMGAASPSQAHDEMSGNRASHMMKNTIEGIAQQGELTAHVGHHPTRPVGGVAFIDHPAVRELVKASVEDQGLRNLLLRQTRERAFATNVFESQGKLYFYAYDPTHGSETNWGISISPDGTDGAVCIATAPSGAAPPPGDWYRSGKVIASTPGGCPSDAAGLSRAFGG